MSITVSFHPESDPEMHKQETCSVIHYGSDHGAGYTDLSIFLKTRAQARALIAVAQAALASLPDDGEPALAGEMDAEVQRQQSVEVPLNASRADIPQSADTFTCCNTPMFWPTRQEDRTCPECGLVWEREPVDLGAGARIKGARDQTSPSASSGPGVVPSLVPAPSERDSDVQPDPYIDAIAAEHIQEYEPALAEPLLVCYLCGATDLVLMCVSGPRCHNHALCAERVAARDAEAAQVTA